MMKAEIQSLFTDISSKDDKVRFDALDKLLAITEKKVDWFEEVFEELSNKLKSENSYQRSIGMMLLCNLAKSDTQNKIQSILPEIMALIDDEKFITRRQCIRNLWKIAVEKPAAYNIIINKLADKYKSCITEKHYNLLRQDIIQTLNKIYLKNNDNDLQSKIIKLIQSEENEKYKKNYLKTIQK